MAFALIQGGLSFAIIDISCYDEWGTSHPGVEMGLANLVLAAFFLALSIVGCVMAFRKKKA